VVVAMAAASSDASSSGTRTVGLQVRSTPAAGTNWRADLMMIMVMIAVIVIVIMMIIVIMIVMMSSE
jgi:heme/copper-type cytochrome/quinol oxidase subunit 2